jgi:acetolactate decarboxylase
MKIPSQKKSGFTNIGYYYSLSRLALVICIAFSVGCNPAKEETNEEVRLVGEMKNIMWKGQLQGNIYLDSIANKNLLNGLGPLDSLSGEILILDGKSYISRVLTDSTMEVKENFDTRAPFFAYAPIAAWTTEDLPDSVQNLQQLEQFLSVRSKATQNPFLFKVSGTVEDATIHVVNLPRGTKVSSPEEAHLGRTFYSLKNEAVDLVGFYSKNHKTIFTHHDTFIHIHLINSKRDKMGHLDEVRFKKQSIKLHLPASMRR